MRFTTKIGECIFADSLDIMPRYPDKFFDLCISDIPWGSEYDKREKREEKIHYNDAFDPKMCLRWLHECDRIAKTTIFMVGTTNFLWWIKNTDPVDIFYFTYPFTKTPSTISRVTQISPLLVWGERKQWLDSNQIKDKVISHPKHPAAKSTIGFEKVISSIKPTSVIDPFAGTCVIGEVCELLQIRYVCIEKDFQFIPYAKKRILNGIKNRKKRKRKNLDGFLHHV